VAEVPEPPPAAVEVPRAEVEAPAPPQLPPEVEAPPPEAEAEVQVAPETRDEPGRVVVDMTKADRAVREAEPSEEEEKDDKAKARPERQHGAEVDRVALTREFAQLFDMERGDDS
jgi:hypothetical protein